jgi:hypothetical protein
MTQLKWVRDPGRLTLSQATSAAYRYDIRVTDDGRAALAVRHAHAGLDAEPVKTFTYKTVPAARNGAQRFEDKHGYAESDVDRINQLCAMAWDEGFAAGYSADHNSLAPSADVNPYCKTETTED